MPFLSIKLFVRSFCPICVLNILTTPHKLFLWSSSASYHRDADRCRKDAGQKLAGVWFGPSWIREIAGNKGPPENKRPPENASKKKLGAEFRSTPLSSFPPSPAKPSAVVSIFLMKLALYFSECLVYFQREPESDMGTWGSLAMTPIH